jgi:peptidyl-prolyl cis-trans isomerase SurA
MKHSPRLPVIGILLSVLVFFSGTLTCAAAPKVDEVDRIVAIVDDNVVVRSELDDEMQQIMAQLQKQNTQLPPREVVERQVLERLILTKLELAAAERAGITVGDDLMAQAINNIAQRNNLTLSQFRAALQEQGLTFEGFRKQLRQQIIIQRLLEREVGAHINITEREIDDAIARQSDQPQQRTAYHLQHILVAVPQGSSSETLQAAKVKAQKLVDKLRAGADFQQVAMSESDSHQALEGGDLGWRAANQLPTIFAEVVPKMEQGGISDPIRSASGFHIIKLVEYKGGGASGGHIVTQTHARHILIRTNEITSDNDARTRLQQLRQRIIGGDDFAELARSHSDDKASAINGGDLGWINSGDLVPEFEQEMQELSPGEISQPFRTPFGWHIVQILERRQHDSTEEVQRAEARAAIHQRKMAEETELYLRRLRDEAYVEIRLEDDI